MQNKVRTSPPGMTAQIAELLACVAAAVAIVAAARDGGGGEDGADRPAPRPAGCAVGEGG